MQEWKSLVRAAKFLTLGPCGISRANLSCGRGVEWQYFGLALVRYINQASDARSHLQGLLRREKSISHKHRGHRVDTAWHATSEVVGERGVTEDRGASMTHAMTAWMGHGQAVD